MKDNMKQYIQDLFFGYSTQSILNNSRVNQLLSFDELVNVLGSSPTEQYLEISRRAISTLDAGGELKAVKNEIDGLKKSLHPVLFSGFTEIGHGDTTGEFDYNGCVQVDLDFKVTGGQHLARVAFDKITKLPYVLLAAISPSGVGVKALVSTTNDVKIRHKLVSTQVTAAVGSEINVDGNQFDTIGYASVCYGLQAGADLYVNRNAEQFKYVHVASTVQDHIQSNQITVNLTSTDEQVNIRLKRAYDRVKAAVPKFDTPAIQQFAGIIGMWAIEFEVGRDFLFANGQTQNLTENGNKRLKSLESICRKNKSGPNWGKALTQVVEIDLGSNQFKDKCNSDIKIDKYLSEVQDQITVESKTMIVAPTGSGKSTWVKNLSIPRIMVVPTRVMVDQIAEEAGAVRFYGGDHKAKITDNFIVTTYSSLPTLNTHFKEVGLSRYTLFLDEVHVFTSNAAPSFQLGDLRDALKIINENKWLSLTATPLFNFAPELEPTKVFKVSRNVNPIKKYQQVACKRSVLESVIVNVAESKKIGKKSFVFFNNTKEDGAFGELMSGLVNKNVIAVAVNSPTAMQSKQKSNSSDFTGFNEIVFDQDITNVDAVVATSLFKEGMSVTKGLGTEVDIHIIGAWHPMEIEQFSNRARGVNSITAYHYRSEKTCLEQEQEHKSPTQPLPNINYIRENTVAHASKVATAFTELAKVSDLNVSAIKSIATRLEHADAIWFDKETKVCTPDNLLLSHSVYRKESMFAHGSKAVMEHKLAEYDWSFTLNSFTVSQHLTKDELSDIKNDVNTKKEENSKLVSKRIDELSKKITIADVCDYAEEIKTNAPEILNKSDEIDHQLKLKLCSITKAFNQTTGSIDKAFRVLNHIGQDNGAISRMWDIVKMDRLVTGNDGFGINYTAYNEIYNLYLDEWRKDNSHVYTSSDMVNAVINSIVTIGYEPTFGDLLKKDQKELNAIAAREFSQMFEIEPAFARVVEEGKFTKTGKPVKKSVRGFKIVGPAIDQFYRITGWDKIHQVQTKEQVSSTVISNIVETIEPTAREFASNFINPTKAEYVKSIIVTPVQQIEIKHNPVINKIVEKTCEQNRILRNKTNALKKRSSLDL